MRRFPTKIWLLMVITAGFSIPISYVTMQSRERARELSRRYTSDSGWNAYAEQLALVDANASPEEFVQAYQKLIDYHRAMKLKYMAAAAQPLKPLEPDPPAPIEPRSGMPYMRQHPYGEE